MTTWTDTAILADGLRLLSTLHNQDRLKRVGKPAVAQAEVQRQKKDPPSP